MSFALLTLSLFCARPAQAQGSPGDGGDGGDGPSWQMTIHANGSTKLDEFDPQGNHFHYETPWTDPHFDPAYFGGDFSLPGGWTAAEESKGTITYQFDYLDPSGDTITPPFDHTWVKKTGYSNWASSYQDAGASSGSASDGMGDSEDRTDTATGTSSGSHYERKDTSSGSFSVPASPQTSVASTDPSGSQGNESLTFTVQDVGLPLISSTIDASTKKGGAPNKRGQTGSLAADCAAVYDYNSGVWRGATDLGCTSPFDDALYTWHAYGGTPSATDESDVLGHPSRFLANVSLDMGLSADDTGLPMTTVVTTQVASQTDPSATDTANYAVTWHAPYEKISEALDIDSWNVIETRFSGVSPSGFGSAPESKAGKIPSELYVEGALIGFALAGQEEIVGLLEVCCHICNVVDFVKDYDEEPPFTNGNRNDGTSWHVAQGLGHVPPEYANDPDGWTHCTMSWCRVAHWTDVHYDCDKFGPHGWVAGGPYDQHYKHVYNISDEPFFTSSGPGGSGGTGGSGGGGAE